MPEQFVLSDTLLYLPGNLLIYCLSNRCHIMPHSHTHKHTSPPTAFTCPYVLKSVVSESLSPRVDVSSV